MAPELIKSFKPVSRKQVRTTEEQYYREIPRAVLENFHLGPTLYKVDCAHFFRGSAALAEGLAVYDIASKTLEKRAIDRSYVVKDLYRDASSPREALELEGKLAKLEQHATHVFHDVHDAIPKGKITLSRAHLDDLCKYLFIMNFRRQVLCLSYYDKDRPSDVALRERFERYGRTHGADTPIDTWLLLLDDLLDTPSDVIDRVGGAWLQQQSMDSLLDNFGIDVSYAIDYFPAINFELQSQAYFVGFWEAADTDEFVLTPSAFGYWEGCLASHPDFHLHRIFTISPRLAIVLRSDYMRQGVGFDRYRKSACSTLLDLPVSPPHIDFTPAGHPVVVDGEVAFTMHAAYDNNPEMRRERRQRDAFTMRIEKLSPEQMLAVNAATLRSTRPDGSLTFTSRSLITRTLRHYMHCTPAWADMCWDSYRALAERLARPYAPDTPSLARIGSIDHEEAFQWLMDLVHEATAPTSPLSLYMCGAAVVRQLSEPCDARSTAFAELYSRYAGALIDHLRSQLVPAGSLIPRDSKGWTRPHTLDHDVAIRFIETARPLLRKVVPECVCTAKSSEADKILEAAIIVRFLDEVVTDPRLVATLRVRCPSFFRWLHLCPCSGATDLDLHVDCTALPTDPNWPPVHRDVRKKFDSIWRGMLKGEITFPNRYARGRALHECTEIMWKTPALEGPITHTFALNMPVIGKRMVTEYFPTKPPGFQERPHSRPRGDLSHEAAELIMHAITEFIHRMDITMFDEDGPHPDPRMAQMRQYANDLLIYGYLDFLTRMRPDILEGILGKKYWNVFIEDDSR
ncbi:hypothetical protein HDZ31DRAFT_64332 [Schizophyllum fasciatum]